MNGNCSILIIDDDESNLALIESYLSDAGYDVVTATNGKEAWEFIQLFGCELSLVLLDWNMPVMNGYEFMKLIKGHREHYEIPVILQTSVASPEKVRLMLDCGAYHYLVKPYDEEKLLKVISKVLKGKRNIKTLRERNSMINKQNDLLIDQSILRNL